MRKIISASLALLLLVCAILPVYATEATDPTEPTGGKEREHNTVPDPLTWEELNALPIANEEMTEDELRQLCVDFMKLQLTVQWTPKGRVDSYKHNGKDVMVRPEEVYCGLPYITSRFGNIYNLMTYYDEKTGRVNMDAMGDNLELLIGNQCSSSVYWAWARVTNCVNYEGSANLPLSEDYIRVGDYTIDESITSFHKDGIQTSQITKENGEKVMFDAYAKMKPADALARYVGSAGHVIMVASAPVVVYKEDGSIDGDQSYIAYFDQTSKWKDFTLEDGTVAQIQSGIDKTATFTALYNNGSLPVCIPEFCGKDPVEKGEASIGYEGDEVDMETLRDKNMLTNYNLITVRAIVTDENGEEIYNEVTPTAGIRLKGYMLRSVLRDRKLDKLAESGKNTISIVCLMSNGQHLTAYTGKLVAQLPEPAPALPGWVVPVCIAAAVVVLGGVAWVIIVRSRKKKEQ